jgi:hypothetical protein
MGVTPVTCYYLKQLIFFPINCQFLFLILVVWLEYYLHFGFFGREFE